jgi:pyruvate dehydrogenase E2 component (dihydrolipoamide acetyltransferase)
MTLEFKLPDIGEGIAEGEIVKWLVAEGDTVEEHQPVVEVMTDKATVEVPAPAAGKITKQLAAEGDVIPVGNVIFHLESGSGGAAAPAAAPQAEPAKAEAPNQAAPEQASAPAPAPSKGGGGAVMEFKLPDIGEGIAEGEIVKWLVTEGTVVEEHQPVVEVMTDKATVEVPAPAAGTISKQLVGEGDVVPVGSVIFHLTTEGGASAPAAQPAQAAPAAPAAAAAPAPAAAAQQNGKPVRAEGEPILAVPSARRVARELGVDLAYVAGSGRNGVVRRADVETYAKSGGQSGAPAKAAPAAAAPAKAPAKPVTLAATESETRVPFRGVRRKIAEAMTRSKYTATHFTVVEELDVTDLVTARAAAKAIGSEEGVNVTYMPFIMKATASALVKYPQLGCALDETTQEVVTYNHQHLGIATDTENGLIVPVIRHVGQKGMLQLAKELADLAGRTREGKIMPDELRGSTFTITNAGNIGGILATPIINFPEVAILGVHRIQKKPGVISGPNGDEIAVRSYMNLSISVDHRLVDGADAVRFLVHIKRLLENPALLAL